MAVPPHSPAPRAPQVANHPYLIEDTEPPPASGPGDEERLARLRISASGKLQLLDSLLAQLQERGHRVSAGSACKSHPQKIDIFGV